MAWAGGTSSSSGPRRVGSYFDDEGDARRMLQWLLDTVAPELSNWAMMTAPPRR
jgi:hypothetical protein